MSDLLLHPETKRQFELLRANPTHAIMITGRSGSGKRTIAEELLRSIFGNNLDSHPYLLRIAPMTNTITIEQIRELQNFIKLKTTGTARIRRAILIENAHLMGIEAQNALLKTLEEPPHDTVLILTANADARLKPTIYSRVQKLHVRPLARKHLENLEQSYSTTEIEKAYNLSGGETGLFFAILSESQDHELTRSIAEAKTILTASAFERLAMVEQLLKSKTDIAGLLGALKRVAKAALKAAVSRGDVSAQMQWQKRLEAAYKAEKQLASNAQPKLLLTNLFLSI